MKIGLIIYGSLDTLTGGYLYDRYVIEYLQSAGHSVHIFSQEQQVYPANILQNRDRNLLRRIMDADLDLLLEDELNHPSLFALNRRIKKECDIPIIGIVHSLRHRFPLSLTSRMFSRILEQKFLRSLDGYIAVSQYSRAQVQDLISSDKLHTVAYPAGNRFERTVTEEDIQRKIMQSPPLHILFLGNITPNKNILGLLDAVQFLDKSDIHVTVIGETKTKSSYYRQVRRFIAKHRMEDQVTFTGKITNPVRIAEYYRKAHLLVLPSFTEGFPLVHVEAAGFGVPSIATSRSGAGEFIEHGVNGFIVDPDDTSTLHDHINTLANDINLLRSMSQAALQRFNSHPTWEETGETVHSFLKQFVHGELAR